VLFIYVGSLLQIKYLLPGVALSHLIIFGIPVLAAWYGKCDFKETFSLKKIKPLWIPLSILAGVAAFFAFNGIMQLLSNVIPGAAENYAQSMDQLMEGNSLWVKILVIALVPAVSEETLFRGYVLGSLRPKLKPWAVILITAVLFGVYHMNLFQGIYAALLGTVLAGAVYLTGSIFPASIIHFTANLLALIVPLIWK
ncbi:MAG: CPBP family intramembrane metalloprotease, partial [Lachnospiraceae bacterium]|nr:CPBP family intramembrane metalloprotease [Candidatus Hippenecus merdae]